MKNNNFIKNVLFTAVLSAAVTGCDFASAPKDEIHADGKTMGTFFSITVVGDYPGGQKVWTGMLKKFFIKLIKTYLPLTKTAFCQSSIVQNQQSLSR